MYEIKVDKEKSELFMKTFVYIMETYKYESEESLITHVADILTERKIDIETYCFWLKNHKDIISALGHSCYKFKMLKFINRLESFSTSVEDLF